MTGFKHTHLPLFLTALCLVGLSGCSFHLAVPEVFAYETVKRGDTFKLQQGIHFPAYTAAVTIQNGSQKSGFKLDQYYPFCTLELKTQSSSYRIIQQDTFTVYKVNAYTEYVMKPGVHYASLGLLLANNSSDIVYKTVFYLKSENQPDVELLSCQHWDDPSTHPYHLSLKQIKQTLNGVFIIDSVQP